MNRKEYLKKWREDNKEHIQNYKKEYYKTHDSSFKKLQNKYKKLQQENKQLNGAVQTYDILLKSNVEENKQLNIQISAREEVCNRLESNWNKLRKYLESYIKLMNNNPDIIEQGQLDILYEVKDKIQELEGSDSDE